MDAKEREEFRQFNGRTILNLCALGERVIELYKPGDKVCTDHSCRWFSESMEHYIHDHAQLDELYREESKWWAR